MTQRALEKHLQDYGKPGALVGVATQVIIANYDADGYRTFSETSYPYAKYAKAGGFPYGAVLEMVAAVEHHYATHKGPPRDWMIYDATAHLDAVGLLGAYRRDIHWLVDCEHAKRKGEPMPTWIDTMNLHVEMHRRKRRRFDPELGFAQMPMPRVAYSAGADGDLEIKRTSVVHDDGTHPARDASVPMQAQAFLEPKPKRYQWPFKPPH
jgi:hypothetical protein